MSSEIGWSPFEAPVPEILSTFPSPLKNLADGSVPAFIMRQAYNPQHCARLVDRFYERNLLYDPRGESKDGKVRRVDIGTSFGQHRNNREEFLNHSARTLALYESLFDGYDDPVAFIYDTLARLAPDKQVVTAREPDGRSYGPAIFRTYYAGAGHKPHMDSAQKRTKASGYSVSGFDRQFAGILCFQGAEEDGDNGQAFLYRQQWRETIQPYMSDFRRYARDNNIGRIRISLNPGDFYVFCSETIHEVPPPTGDTPRIVLAVFFAMSDDRDEIFVWS